MLHPQHRHDAHAPPLRLHVLLTLRVRANQMRLPRREIPHVLGARDPDEADHVDALRVAKPRHRDAHPAAQPDDALRGGGGGVDERAGDEVELAVGEDAVLHPGEGADAEAVDVAGGGGGGRGGAVGGRRGGDAAEAERGHCGGGELGEGVADEDDLVGGRGGEDDEGVLVDAAAAGLPRHEEGQLRGAEHGGGG
eukprot:CAMPEP_0184732640 /NCGR_PEP_ID=MMETSP0314-20130426/54915_1 /TAXON_ID=38298 /ORGANISM="Rhodella maculata, Strain CCMP 736" /LENGTH=194 /DNA_ID=CAMNT_0027199275 /DNA_START=400 /DNA_END=980 /DNA_ORIENTATION=-